MRLKSESGSSVSVSPGVYGNRKDSVSKTLRGSKSTSRASRSRTNCRGKCSSGSSGEGMFLSTYYC